MSGTKDICGNFFLVVPPGLEALALAELQAKGPLLAQRLAVGLRAETVTEVCEGGIELKNVNMLWGCMLNLTLKIPTRILLRLSVFKCRDFPKLYNKLRKLEWSPYLGGTTPSVQVAAHTSRLMHKGRLSETLAEAIKSYYKAHPPKQINLAKALEQAAPVLYLRFMADECTLSIDTSGEPLYKRWAGKKVGPAPLRENLSAAVFQQLQQKFSSHWKKILLVDPLCGSGTLLAEAKTYHCLHAERDYAFKHFPMFNKTVFANLGLGPLEPLYEPDCRIEASGFDRDALSIEYAQDNYAHLGLQFKERALEATLPAELKETLHEFDAVCLLANPPYGKRLSVAEALHVNYGKLLAKLKSDFKPQLIALIVPSHAAAKLKGSSVCKFKNGGINVSMLMVEIDDER